MQNTQHAFCIYGEIFSTQHMINHLTLLNVGMFAAISPNLNWCNKSHAIKTKQIFCKHSPHVHISSNSSDIGYEKEYLFDPHLIGGNTLLTFGIWASKVSSIDMDTSGQGVYTSTTIMGKNKKMITFITAYISVLKGNDIGVESLYAQQLMIHEKQAIRQKSTPNPHSAQRKMQ
jgi:hypothetical protein